MVTEKNSDVIHDFFNDPLRLQSDGVWLKVSALSHGAAHLLWGGERRQELAFLLKTHRWHRAEAGNISVSFL